MSLSLVFLLFSNTRKKIETKNQYSIRKTRVSWYGPGFNGRKTASGEIYCQDSLTCASPKLPFGTKVKVINRNNNHSVIVRVNDRGPFAVTKEGKLVRPLKAHPRRAFDLSKEAFSRLANTKKGVIDVEYIIL